MFRRLMAYRAARTTNRLAADGKHPPTVPAARSDPAPTAAALDPEAPPDYFGPVAHYALSPLAEPDPAGGVRPGTGIRKFVTALPRLGGTPNELGNLIPVAVPDTVTYPGCDYYEIGIQQYSQRLHNDLPATRLRGYRQLNHGTDATGQNSVAPPDRPHYLGPVIIAERDRPVRIRYVNQLPTGAAGDLFLPVDPTVPGTTVGCGANGGPPRPLPGNRTSVHLAGGANPWISDGGPDQWFTPAGEPTPYPRGAAFAPVPDMPAPEPGTATAFYPNRQSARLLRYHDNTAGIGRLATYAGALGLYLLRDRVERELIEEGVLPADEIVLVIEDKTFVPPEAQLVAQDPTWDRIRWGGPGSLWFPHVYLPNQNPYRADGRNPIGRWDYGPWSPEPGAVPGHGPVPNPYHDPSRSDDEPPVAPGVPTPSAVPTAFLDTPLVNGCAYPYLRLRPRAYRFRILNACPDRTLNLQLYYAVSNGPMWRPDGTLADPQAGEVPMVPAAPTPGFPPTWPTDGREGGVPQPEARGPDWYQIGTGGGLLPQVAVWPNQPVDYGQDRRAATVLNIARHTLLLAPGERADVVVDLADVPPGSNLILYNDAPAPLPRFDARYDHYTGAPDRTAVGGSPSTPPGYGPNTRTLMQLRVVGPPAPPFDLARLQRRLPEAYARSQPPPIVPDPVYDDAFGTVTPPEGRRPLHPGHLTFRPATDRSAPGGTPGPATRPLVVRDLIDDFEPDYGRQVVRIDGPPAGDVLEPVDPGALSGPTGRGTEADRLWRLTPRGALSRTVHFRYLNVQIVHRIGHDGTVRPPAADEYGWRDSVRVDPHEDVVIALRPTLPDELPFKVGDRLLAGPDGAPSLTMGWEYDWHCHPADQPDSRAARPLVLRFSPAAPTGLTVTPMNGSVTVPAAIGVLWTDNARRPAADNILIERATHPAFLTGVTPIVVPADRRGYTDATVVPGLTYYYRVRAEHRVGHSRWSNVAGASVHLLPPVRLTASVPVGTPLRVALRWSNRSFGSSVEIQRATNPTFTSGLVTVTLPVGISYTDHTVAMETIYHYRVRTRYLGAASPWSNTTTAVLPGIPSVPVEFLATARISATGSGEVELYWSGPPTARITGYELQRGTDPGFACAPTTLTLPGDTHRYTDAGLTTGRTYWYRVRSCNAAGTSAFTTELPVVIPAPTTQPPPSTEPSP